MLRLLRIFSYFSLLSRLLVVLYRSVFIFILLLLCLAGLIITVLLLWYEIDNHNMDLGDAWEHADHPQYPEKYASLAYRIGINYIIYAMSH